MSDWECLRIRIPNQRTKILETIEKSWGKFGADEYKASDTLFGKEFQSFLTGKVEKECSIIQSCVNYEEKPEKQGAVKLFQQKGRAVIHLFFFEGALLPSMGAGRARIHTCTHPKASNGRKDNWRGAVGHSTTPGPRTKTTTRRSESKSTEEVLQRLCQQAT